MTISEILYKPFSKNSRTVYSQAIQSAIVLIPLIGVLLINQSVQNPGLFFGGLATYFVIFMTIGHRFEIWRARRFLGQPLRARFSFGKALAYAAIDIVLGTFTSMLVITWLITLVRNILIYPFAEWGHSYPDLAWGGPTWQGAIALHTGSAILSIFIMPWALAWLVRLQMQLISKLLAPETHRTVL